MDQLVTYIIRGLVDNPDQVQVNKIEGDSTIILELSVAPGDRELVTGDDGETLEHLKAVLAAASGHRKAVLELLDNEPSGSDEE